MIPLCSISAALLAVSVAYGSRPDADGVLAYAARQARLALAAVDSNGTHTVTLRTDPSLGSRQSKVAIGRCGTDISGDTPREVLQGVYRFEATLRDRHGAFPGCATNTYTRLFSPRIVHSGRGVGDYPDEHLDEIARAGMDAVVIYLSDSPNVTRTGKMDLGAFARNVRRHGLDVYLYLDRWKKPFAVNPTEPDAESFYGEFFGEIVRAAPELKGIVLVGESVPFPSRDAGVAGYGWEPRRPGAKAANGFWPVSEWKALLEIVTRSTRRYNPDFDVVFWTYSWASAPQCDRLALLESIPTNVTLQVTFELGDREIERNGRRVRADDYTITVPGPSAVFRSEAAVAKRRGIRLSAMSCTGGRTWDFGGVPFVPVTAQWSERLRNLRRAREEYGLSGLMDSHAFGFVSNPIAEMAKAAFTAEASGRDVGNALAAYAARVFGRGADDALAAMRDWSEGFRYHSAAALEQYGVLRIGPTYPLVFHAEKVPGPPAGYCAANKRPGRWAYLFETAGFGEMDRHEARLTLEWAVREAAAWRRGNERLAAAVGRFGVRDPEAAQRLMGVGRYCEATARTLGNLRRYQLLGPDGDPEELRRVIDDEAENVRSLLPVVERDSAIGFDPNMRRIAGPEMLRWKLGQLALRKPGGKAAGDASEQE